jgi:hypothetical protein
LAHQQQHGRDERDERARCAGADHIHILAAAAHGCKTVLEPAHAIHQ